MIETPKPLPAQDYLALPEKSSTNVQLLPPAQSDAVARAADASKVWDSFLISVLGAFVVPGELESGWQGLA